MKGKKLSVALVSTFIAALGLTACGNVQPDGTNIVTIKGYDGKTIPIDAKAIYDEYKNTENGISSFYKAILEVLIRNHFQAPENATKLAEFKGLAENKVKGVRETAADNAETNASDYAKELEKLLKDTYHVENEDELFELFLYEYEKEEYEDKYFVDHLSGLTSEYIGFEQNENKDWVPTASTKHEASYPYHIRHILVKTSASKSDYVTGEITKEEAKKLYTVYNDLASGRYTFGKVASKWSDDGSASSYGDAGIMSTSTSFVNEFKLGTYAFDRVHSNGVLDAFGMDKVYAHSAAHKTVGETLKEIGLEQVSYEVFNRLGECYDEEKSEAGLTVNDGVAKYYPRNIYWNHFLNKHNPMVIVDNGGALGDGVPAPLESERPVELTTSGKVGFRTLDFNGTPLKVLSDEAGRPIYLTRSEYGIHFMVMQRTPFEHDGTVKSWTKDGGYVNDSVTIDQYYTTKTPGAEGYPQYEDGTDKVTFVNHLLDDKSSYNNRADTVKTAIKSFDPMYDYRMFEALVDDGTIKIAEEAVANNIKTYIENKRAYNSYKDAEGVYDTWEDYLDVLSQQELQWGVTYKDTTAGADMHRYVNLSCARKFKTYDPETGAWIKGGECYYAK